MMAAQLFEEHSCCILIDMGDLLWCWCFSFLLSILSLKSASSVSEDDPCDEHFYVEMTPLYLPGGDFHCLHVHTIFIESFQRLTCFHELMYVKMIICNIFNILFLSRLGGVVLQN